MYPTGKVSILQEKQLTTLGGNIKALEVNGTFDQCQFLVKEAFMDENLKNLNNSVAAYEKISKIQLYPTEFEKDKREIYVDGEIYIEVARDEERPFYVRTKDMNVRVLGTKFNVRSYTTEDRHVTLVQGKVQVTNTNSLSSVVLQPGQDLTYTETGEEKISRVNIATYTDRKSVV